MVHLRNVFTSHDLTRFDSDRERLQVMESAVFTGVHGLSGPHVTLSHAVS